MDEFAKNLDNLPMEVLEIIFQYLSTQDLLKCKLAIPELQCVCDKCTMKRIDFVFKDIFNCMATLEERMNGIHLSFKEKRKLLRSSNILANIKFNLEIGLILTRPDLGPNITFNLAKIFDNSKNVIDLIKRNPFDLRTLYIANMYAQNDINDLLFKNDHLNNAYMGVQIVDYLDLIYHVQYNINVTYYIKRNICTISGNYHLKHSKLLFYLPELPFIKTCSDRLVTDDEQIALIKYLALLVSVHNRLIAKAEQTKRDLKLSIWELLKTAPAVQERAETKQKGTTYNISRAHRIRNIVDNQNQIVNECYTNNENCDQENSQEGINCEIYLECQIDDAPIEIIKSYKNLKYDLLDVFKCDDDRTIENHLNDTTELYRFDIKLNINLSTKKSDIIELHFNHNNNKKLLNNTV